MSNASQIVQRLWNYCNILKDDGVSYGDYVEQLTYLLFLKMEDENVSGSKTTSLPPGYDWKTLRGKDTKSVSDYYSNLLINLGEERGLIGEIFRKAQNKIHDPAKLKRLVALIDGETWSSSDIDVKGEIYEGILQKNAEDTKSGAGQYFTPRPLIKTIVEVMKPTPEMDIADPACGTGGFFLAVQRYLTAEGRFVLDRKQKARLRKGIFRGWEIVENTARLCLMNLHLHGVGTDKSIPITIADGLVSKPKTQFDMVLSNPPFGKRSSMTMVTDGKVRVDDSLYYRRDDFFATTSNKQLNFLQHIITMLKDCGKAAVVLPDNVLFEGGAGEIVRKRILKECNLHTILRLPPGIFYAQGVKANVFFFDRCDLSDERPRTNRVWIYDFRTGKSFTLRTRQMQKPHLADFIDCFQAENQQLRTESEFFRSFSYEEIAKRDKFNLDISWPISKSGNSAPKLGDTNSLIDEIIGHLDSAKAFFESVKREL